MPKETAPALLGGREGDHSGGLQARVWLVLGYLPDSLYAPCPDSPALLAHRMKQSHKPHSGASG